MSRKPKATNEPTTQTQGANQQKHQEPNPQNVVARKPNPSRNSPNPAKTIASLRPLDANMSSPRIRLLVTSIGNPSPYLNTLHSAGHTMLHHLRERLHYESFRKAGAGQISRGQEFTLFQSGVQMNISGAAVMAAWKTFSREQEQGQEQDAVVVVVLHDELGLGWGQIGVRDGELSPRGHNGLRSVRESLASVRVRWVRVGLGIGRPLSRDPETVAAYVLRKFTPVEKGKLEGCVGAVEAELRRLRGG